jgi:hypothetical protein
MRPNEKQKIEIEKLHPAPLPPLNQAVTADYSDFLGTALIYCEKFPLGVRPEPEILLSTTVPSDAFTSRDPFSASLTALIYVLQQCRYGLDRGEPGRIRLS